jgi:hypothetical protein
VNKVITSKIPAWHSCPVVVIHALACLNVNIQDVRLDALWRRYELVFFVLNMAAKDANIYQIAVVVFYL